MANLKDLMKEALAKKQAEQHPDNTKQSVDKGHNPKSQVGSNKPAKKSAGRGR
jgi:hypothetical protein